MKYLKLGTTQTKVITQLMTWIELLKNFNKIDQVPIVIGVPKVSSPAWGWISELQRTGTVIRGKVGMLHQDLRAVFERGDFCGVSVRIQKPPAGLKLLSYGFVGANGLHGNGFPLVASPFHFDFGYNSQSFNNQSVLILERGFVDLTYKI